ncbi:class I SAM-dependent methyltransferase [Streptomyces sp. NPDC048484]|uniref:class I SAM-dependent methyltransferase n=1 Tax=Streptomyces sp. NPDC048484 TaxID=3155146 RepID=UPI003438C813
MTEPDFIMSTRASYDAIATDYAKTSLAEFAAPLFAGPLLDRAIITTFTESVRTEGPASWAPAATGPAASVGSTAGTAALASTGAVAPLAPVTPIAPVTPVAPVADIGCGPGHITAYLHALGVPVFGIDLSPAMVARARETYPGLRFEVGSMTALDIPDGALGGVAALYSTIHVPDDELPAVFREFHRVLAPGGHVLLAFQTADEQARLTEWFGHAISLDCHWRQPEAVAGLLDRAGLTPRARVVREAYENETLPRAFLLARKQSTDR